VWFCANRRARRFDVVINPGPARSIPREIWQGGLGSGYRPAGRAGLTDRPIRSDPCRELDLDSGTRSPPGAHGPCNDDDDPCAFRVRRSGEFSTCALDRASYAGFRWKSWRPRGFSSQDGWMDAWMGVPCAPGVAALPSNAGLYRT
jgi:hypothetical protein